MEPLIIALGSLLLYVIAYNTYGRWLARRVFKLNRNALTPSTTLNDNRDYVPTGKHVVFGHHFTSIAGTGPIVGPAIAVIWGWLPALLWVLLGSIFMGAVHDFGSLVVSMRNKGQTVGEIIGRVLNPRARILFLFILFMALTIVLAIFGLVIATVFKNYPSAIFPCIIQIPLSVIIGLWLHRKGVHLLIPSVIALILLYCSILFGDVSILGQFNETLKAWPIMTWVVVLLLYAYMASILPVWLLLQPRDYINSLQLLSAMGLLILGLGVAAIYGVPSTDMENDRRVLSIAAPMIKLNAEGAPLIFPFLFITIACGAVSGFHCLVSSGTSSKQLKCESDAQYVGFGSMLTEGFLAVLVILACVAGLGLGIEAADGSFLTGEAAWSARYHSWGNAQGLSAKVGAFVDGGANFLKALGIAPPFAVALMGVLVASFAATTLDTASRLQRYVVQEIANVVSSSKQNYLRQSFSWLKSKHGATLLAITLAVAMAAIPIAGQNWSWASAGRGGLLLWPLFGATNQLLGGLAFLVVALWLWRRKVPVSFIIIPMIFMLVIPFWAMVYQLFIQGVGQEKSWLSTGRENIALVIIAVATLVLEVWLFIEAALVWSRARGVVEKEL